ncbi:MAG TPA: Gfo/Idh/MocA family oxidoreductase [Chloroflexota bacterium]|nr:Gfo/Idh/MocA family oxidoreductase [Chloroflexota bacterium]
MSDRRVRVGVVGAGLFAEQCHIPGIQAHPKGEVVALCARNHARVERLAARFDVPDVHTDYHELVARPDIDAVTVATPDALHCEVTLAALQAGKHVFCEKPLAMNAAQAREMAEARERSDLVGMVAFTFRYSLALMALRRLLRENAIGRPFFVQMQVHWGNLIANTHELVWRDQAAESAAGIWGDGASHLFDALAYALGPVQQICAQMMIVPRDQGTPQPDSIDLAAAMARLRLDGGSNGNLPGFSDRREGDVHVTVLTTRVDRSRLPADEIQVVGTHGAVSSTLTRGAGERASILRAGQSNWEDLDLGPEANSGQPLALTRMMGAFVDAVLRGSLDPDQDPGFDAGLHTQLALEAGLRSARSGRWEDVG